MKLPTLVKIDATTNATRWRADFPSTLTVKGGTYRVTTYPDSDLVYIESWIKRRTVTAPRLKLAIIEALSKLKEPK